MTDTREIGANELGAAALPREIRRDRLPLFGLPPADHDSGRAALGEEPRDRLAQALRPAGDDRYLAVKLAGGYIIHGGSNGYRGKSSR